MLSKTEHIRRVLETNFDLPANDVAERLERKGVEVQPGLVHVVRSTMRKERAVEARKEELAEAGRRADAEAKRLQAEKDAEAAKKKQEKDALQAKMKAMAAKAQQTKTLNPQPLRVHILRVLAEQPGLTIPQIVEKARTSYKLVQDTPEEEEAFKQSVRKKLRLLVTAGDVSQANDVYKIEGVVAVPAKAEVAVAETNGIVFLVSQLKSIVSKLGKDQTKELVDVL